MRVGRRHWRDAPPSLGRICVQNHGLAAELVHNEHRCDCLVSAMWLSYVKSTPRAAVRWAGVSVPRVRASQYQRSTTICFASRAVIRRLTVPSLLFESLAPHPPTTSMTENTVCVLVIIMPHATQHSSPVFPASCSVLYV